VNNNNQPDLFPAFIKFLKDASASNDVGIVFYNVCIVKGLFGVNLTKRQGFFTDYVRYNVQNGYYEASMDDGETYHRILTTREEDVNDFIDILINNDLIYTKKDCDLMF
jgi:hypothetical protein